MTTIIHSRQIPKSLAFATLFQAINHRLRGWLIRRAGQRQIARLDDSLRRDIGLRDSGLTRADRLQAFRSAHRAIPREHEIRIKFWN
jgi:uncharacterized protein YjiS (DUF1127 family)